MFLITEEKLYIFHQSINVSYGFFVKIIFVKQIASPGWMHETSARGWCTGMAQRDGMGREVGERFRMGNTCKCMADSCQCMAKTTTIL